MSIMGSGALSPSPRDPAHGNNVTEMTPPAYYVWEPPGKAIRILMDFDVIDKMSQDVMRGFGAVPRRGAEVGGVLLGSVEVGEKLVVHVTGFETVPCQHKRGPSFLLTEADEAAFDETLQRLRQTAQPIGFYRSHTREGLGLTEEDLAFFSRYFPDPQSVILLIRPYATRVSMAGFFFEENGQIRGDQSFLEFPFRRRELGGGAPAPVEHARHSSSLAEMPVAGGDPVSMPGPKVAPIRPPSGWTPPAAPAGEAPPLPPPRPEIAYVADDDDPQAMDALMKFKRGWVWLPLSFLFLALGLTIGFFVAHWSSKAPGKGQRDLYRLSMTVKKDPNSYHVTWDRGSPAIQNAQRGVMHITDGLLQKDVDLKPEDLRNGSVVYRSPSGNRMVFQIELLMTDGNVLTETYVIPKITRGEKLREAAQ